jgi:hypothetical protein
MKRLPKILAAVTLGGCSGPSSAPSDAGDDAAPDASYDAGIDAGYDAGVAATGTPWGDAGCVLPSDFPWDGGGTNNLADEVCLCVTDPEQVKCPEEGGPRCAEGWECYLGSDGDGGYDYLPDGGVYCFC